MRLLISCLAIVLAAATAGAEVRVEVAADGQRVFSNVGSTPRPAVRLGVRKRPADLDPLIATHAERQRLDPELVHAVIRAESGYNPLAVSPKGAIGLMQLMPATARDLEVEDPRDPASNIAGGTRYLRLMLDTFEGSLELALAGYNAGPQAVRRFGGVPPYSETRRYVERVLRDYRNDAEYFLPAGGGPALGRKVFISRDSAGGLVLTTFQGD